MQHTLTAHLSGRRSAALAVAILCGLLTACAQPQKPLYQWNGYQSNLYEYFKNSGANAGEQIDKLEAQLAKNKAANEATPPGLHGHLALMYAKVGNDSAAASHLEAERALFPESAAYVDLLLKKRTAATAAATGTTPTTPPAGAASGAAKTSAATPTGATTAAGTPAVAR